jgi:hypothetical protein
MKPLEQSTLTAAGLREHGTNRSAHVKEKRGPHSTLAWAAVALGLLFGIAGIFHTTAVISVALRQSKPYDFRMVSLLATGGILVYPALINIGISRWIKQGHPWALAMSAVVTLPLMVYEALLVPARHSNQMLGVIINGLYLCFLTIAWVSQSAFASRLRDRGTNADAAVTP